MPAEKFWNSDQVERDEPNLTISWGHPVPGEIVTPLITASGMPLLLDGGDVTGLDRMIRALKRARRAVLGKTTHEDMAVDSFLKN